MATTRTREKWAFSRIFGQAWGMAMHYVDLPMRQLDVTQHAMDSLIKDAWHLYHVSEATQCVVRPSIPILFFGDSERYDRSPLKVITVGLNPSRLEFPVDDAFKRFPKARHVYPGIVGGLFYADYLDALNEYFRRDPYWRWFNSFEPMLNGMEASYRDGLPNTALHTDLCTPLATAPTWSKLTHERGMLGSVGVKLWHRLARVLAPDVVLISVARQHLATLEFSALGPWETIYTVERANPYRVEAQEVEIVPGKRTLIVFGRAANTPFGTVSNVAKGEIGRCIAECIDGR